jgi:peptidoglycan hydrolase CwlO-like protein
LSFHCFYLLRSLDRQSKAGWIVERSEDLGENDGLKADKNAVESRLKLAQEEQKGVTAQLQILGPDSKKLQAEVTVLAMEVYRIKAVLDGREREIVPQAAKVVESSAALVDTARALSEANTVLGSTLSSPLSASLSLRPEAPSVTLCSE